MVLSGANESANRTGPCAFGGASLRLGEPLPPEDDRPLPLHLLHKLLPCDEVWPGIKLQGNPPRGKVSTRHQQRSLLNPEGIART